MTNAQTATTFDEALASSQEALFSASEKSMLRGHGEARRALENEAASLALTVSFWKKGDDARAVWPKVFAAVTGRTTPVEWFFEAFVGVALAMSTGDLHWNEKGQRLQRLRGEHRRLRLLAAAEGEARSARKRAHRERVAGF